jgi:hypothetical protein
MENLTGVFYTIVGLGTVAGAFKGIDWLIGLKYMTKDNCSVCRAEVAKTQSAENEKLARIETKVDMLLEMRKNETQF